MQGHWGEIEESGGDSRTLPAVSQTPGFHVGLLMLNARNGFVIVLDRRFWGAGVV